MTGTPVGFSVSFVWSAPTSSIQKLFPETPPTATVEVPSLGLRLDASTPMRNQELGGELKYWEGAMDFSGTAKGVGYLEMTGYAGPPPRL